MKLAWYQINTQSANLQFAVHANIELHESWNLTVGDHHESLPKHLNIELVKKRALVLIVKEVEAALNSIRHDHVQDKGLKAREAFYGCHPALDDVIKTFILQRRQTLYNALTAPPDFAVLKPSESTLDQYVSEALVMPDKLWEPFLT